MPKKKLPQTIEECNAELERTQKLLQQYENRNKMLNRKLSTEKRKERNHRIFLFGGFMESIVPELKTTAVGATTSPQSMPIILSQRSARAMRARNFCAVQRSTL